MTTAWVHSCLLLLLLLTNNIDIYASEYGTCDDPFIIFKHTVATSNSVRECENYSSIFLDIHDEGANKFINGLCAYQCKLELPYTCFKIHAPQTQFEEGLLHIATFENKMSEKWKYALNDNSIKYDAFFDNNIAFWVNSLDEYILHWQSNQNVKFEYFGIEWNLYDINIDDDQFKNNKFYSILIHSPQSARNFEFISYIKPYLHTNIKWITDDIPRCTFKMQNNPYPWHRNDKATIVPIRISQPTTNIDKMHDFYVHILEADLLYYAKSIQSDTKAMFLALTNTHIEILFIERNPFAAIATFDDFTLDKYENLLMETHETIITSPFCGQDRWMDNHYAFETYVVPGLLDKIYSNLNKYNIKYTVHKNTAQHVSDYIKHQLELINYSGEYTFGLWIIEPTGNSIKMGGIISDSNVAYYANTNDPQWCPRQCNWGLVQGTIDPKDIYIDDTSDTTYYYHQLYVDPVNRSIIYRFLVTIMTLVFLYLVYHYLWYYVYEKQTSICSNYVPI